MARVKLQWIVNKKKREAAFRNRRATLLKKARELSTLCGVPVAAVVYAGASNAEPAATFPPAPEEARLREILQRFADLPESSRGSLDSESFLSERIGKVAKKLENLKVGNRDREVNLVLNDFSLRRRNNLDGLSPELAAAVVSVLKKRARGIAAAAAAEAAPVVEEASVVVAEADVALVLPAAVEKPDAAVDADVPVDMDGGEPAEEGFLKEVVQIIMDDGSGSSVVPTKADVGRVLKEHGLRLFKPQ